MISCAYRLSGRLSPEAHSDLPMMLMMLSEVLHDHVVTKREVSSHLSTYFRLSGVNCVCARGLTDGCWWLSAMQRAGEVECVCEGRGAVCRNEGGWKQNRTALTTEPKDKEKAGLADRKGSLGAWSCYMKGNRKELRLNDNQRLSEENTPLTQTLLLSLPLERTDHICVQL